MLVFFLRGLLVLGVFSVPVVARDTSLLLQTEYATSDSGRRRRQDTPEARCVAQWEESRAILSGTKEGIQGEQKSKLLMQKIIEDVCVLQNPRSCKDRPVLLVSKDHTKGCGFGCWLAHLAYVLAEGVHRNATVVLSARSNTWFSELFLPISSCSPDDASAELQGGFGDVALWSLPARYRGEDLGRHQRVDASGNVMAKLFASSLVSFALRPASTLRKEIMEELSCYGLGMYSQHGVVTMHFRQGDRSNHPYSKENAKFDDLKVYFDQLDQLPSEDQDKLAAVHVTSDSPIDLDTLTKAQRERWPNVIVTGKDGSCSNRTTAPRGTGVHKEAYLGGKDGVLTDLAKSVSILSEAILDIFILASGNVFVGAGMSHFTTAAQLLHFSRQDHFEIIADRMVDADQLAKGASPVGFVHKMNCDGSIPFDEQIKKEIRARKTDKSFFTQCAEPEFSKVSVCEARRNEKGVLSEVDSDQLIMKYDAEVMAPVVNLDLFDPYMAQITPLAKRTLPSSLRKHNTGSQAERVAAVRREFEKDMGAGLVVGLLDEAPSQTALEKMNIELLHSAGICYDCSLREYNIEL